MKRAALPGQIPARSAFPWRCDLSHIDLLRVSLRLGQVRPAQAHYSASQIIIIASSSPHPPEASSSPSHLDLLSFPPSLLPNHQPPITNPQTSYTNRRPASRPPPFCPPRSSREKASPGLRPPDPSPVTPAPSDASRIHLSVACYSLVARAHVDAAGSTESPSTFFGLGQGQVIGRRAISILPPPCRPRPIAPRTAAPGTHSAPRTTATSSDGLNCATPSFCRDKTIYAGRCLVLAPFLSPPVSVRW